jgi:hypothetical protein
MNGKDVTLYSYLITVFGFTNFMDCAWNLDAY